MSHPEHLRPYAVMLIEDDDIDAELLRLMLVRDLGAHDITWVRHLSDARRILEDREFGAIVADLELPDAKRLDVVEMCREVCPSALLIVISGNEDDDLATAAIAHGADDFLVKRLLQPAQLRKAIKYALARTRVA